MVKDNKNNKCQIIDLAVPSDKYFSKGSQETRKA